MDQSSSSEFTINKRESREKKNVSRDESQNQGRWSLDQNLKYLVFLSYNISKFECRKKRMFRLYKPLSKFITTRTSEQCRSHHRKLLQRFKTPKNIVSSLQHQFDQEQIEKLKQMHREVLQQLPIPQKKMRSNEKQEQFSLKSEQKSLYSNQNVNLKLSQLNQKMNVPLQYQNHSTQALLLSQNLPFKEEMLTINYQALNWFNQLYLPNLNYYREPNNLIFYNGFEYTSTNPRNS